MNTWKILVDGSNEDVEMEHLMAFNGLFEYAESYLKDAVGKFLFARSYQYVVEKRLKELGFEAETNFLISQSEYGYPNLNTDFNEFMLVRRWFIHLFNARKLK